MKKRRAIYLIILFFLLASPLVFAASFQWIASFGHPGKEPGEINVPYDVAIGDYRNLYISDSNNHRVQKWDQDGRPLLIFGKEGDGEGEFEKPTGIAIAP
ncbi:MAG TPA: hypothetical protein VI584_01860, partial [Nitrospiria bacterium]|nr:hypothetical protein [Nitrospiria bacterium]